MMSKRDSLPSSSSSSSSSTHQWKYDVFLSFRGEDTRTNFTDHLYVALKKKGIFTFRDDENLEKGKSIHELFEAIEQSRFAIVVFSKNYASSTWCLDELAKIVKCREEMGLTVLPIFYDVDPSDVRKQKGPFEKACTDHEEHFKNYIEKVEPWREALRKVGDISGWHLKNGYESKFIQHIVNGIMDKLNSKFSRVTKNIVGIESALEKLIPSYLSFGNNVCMIGICGMGGMGKTTLARVIYDMYLQQFEGSSFIANVREKSKKGELRKLQQQLLEDILGESNTKIRDVHRGVDIIQNRLPHKRVLLVLDDVSHVDQLEKLAGEHGWFGSGSWIIITTRDEHVLVQHGVLKIYKPNELNDGDALKLLCLKAFKNKQPKKGYMPLSQEVVNYASGLPLAIVTLGSLLIGKTIDEWKSALDNFKKTKGDIFNTFKISYDALPDEMWKEMFLDIACFFRWEKKDRVTQILKNCGFDATYGISILLEKSLLTIDGDILGMHDLLKEMGEKIVRLESRGNLGKQSRLWCIEDLHCLLEKDEATEAIQAIVVTYGDTEGFNFEKFTKVFTKMSNIRLLIIDGQQSIPNALNHVPNSLRHLSWTFCPLECFPSSFQPEELVQLDLRYSDFKYLWEGVKNFGQLKFIDLKCSQLISTPDFSGVPRLERLQLSSCINLVEIHPPVRQLSRFNELHLDDCNRLRLVPELPSSTRYVNAVECPSLEPLAASKIFWRYLQGLSRPKTSPVWKKDGPRTELFQIITSVSDEELHLDAKFCKGNSVSIDLPPNWFNDDRWMGFTVGTQFKDKNFSTYNLRARVIVHGGESDDTPHSHYASEMSIERCKWRSRRSSFWLLYLPRDYWLATVGNGECGRIEFIFEISDPQVEITEQTCTVSSLYHEINFWLNQAADSGDQPQRPPYFGDNDIYIDDDEDEFSRAELQIGLNALNHVHSDLRHLTWTNCPLECFPSSFQPNELVQLELQYSKLKYFWEGGKIFGKLKFIHLGDSKFIRTPDFSGVPRLERLRLSWCTELVEIHPSVGQLSKLKELHLEDCKRLRSVPELPSSTRYVNAVECPSLEPLAATKILCSYLQGLFRRKTIVETSPVREKDGPRTELFQIITSVSEELLLDAKFCEGNSVSIDLPPNWFNDDSWMGFTVGTKFIDVGSLDTFYLRARVIIHGGESGDTPHSHEAFEMSFERCKRVTTTEWRQWRSFWLLYLPRDYWLATVGNDESSRIEFIFETSDPQFKITEQTCTVNSLYREINFWLNQATDSSDQLQRPPFFGDNDKYIDDDEDEFSRAELQIGLNALSHVHSDLRHLSWTSCPLECFPSSFQPNELVQLDVRFGRLKYLWEGGKIFGKLKFIHLRCSRLIRTPDFSGVPRLERLRLSECGELVEIHPSVGQLSRLNELHLEHCYSLTNLPIMSAEMESLTLLSLHWCKNIKNFPEFKGIMKRLSKLYLRGTGIKKLAPSSIECLPALTLLDLSFWESLPSNMDSLRSLEKLILSEISNVVELPASISKLSKLEVLDLSGCDRLRLVPELPSSTRYVNAKRCPSLQPLAASKILCSYLQGLFRPETELQIITSELNFIEQWSLLPYGEFCKGNSVSIDLPRNWFNDDRWVGLAFCTNFKEPWSTFFLRAYVKAIGGESGDTPRGHYTSKMSVEDSSFKQSTVDSLCYLPRDYWFATVGNYECSRIEFTFETSCLYPKVDACAVRLLYEEVEFGSTLNQEMLQHLGNSDIPLNSDKPHRGLFPFRDEWQALSWHPFLPIHSARKRKCILAGAPEFFPQHPYYDDDDEFDGGDDDDDDEFDDVDDIEFDDEFVKAYDKAAGKRPIVE